MAEMKRKLAILVRDFLGLGDNVAISELNLRCTQDSPISIDLKTEVVDKKAESDVAPSPEENKPSEQKKKAKRKKTATPGKGKYSLNREFTTEDEDLTIMRHYLGVWKREKRLTENQLMALDTIGRTSNKKLHHAQKVQILDIFKDVKKKS